MTDTARQVLSAMMAEGYSKTDAIPMTLLALIEFGGCTVAQAHDELFGVGGWDRTVSAIYSAARP